MPQGLKWGRKPVGSVWGGVFMLVELFPALFVVGMILRGIGRKRIRFRTKIPNIFGIRYIMIGKITNRIFFIIILMDFPVSFMRIRAREVQV